MKKQITIKIDLKVFIIGILLIGFVGVISADVILNNSDNIKNWFEQNNITSTNVLNKSLDEINDIGGLPITLVLDLGDGEKSYSGFYFKEYEVEPLMEDLHDIYTCNTYGDFFNQTSNQTEQQITTTINRACVSVILNKTTELEECLQPKQYGTEYCKEWELVDLGGVL